MHTILPTRRAPRSTVLWNTALGLLAAMMLAQLARPAFLGDTPAILAGIRATLAAPGFTPERLSYFPLLPHLLMALPAALGWSDHQIILALRFLNVIAFGAILWGGGKAWREDRCWRRFWCLGMFASPLVFYACTPVIEPLLAALLLALAAAAMRGGSLALIFVLSGAVGTAKEINPIVTMILIAAALIAADTSKAQARRTLVAAGAGAVVAAALNGLFNQWRFGTLANSFYSDDSLQVHELPIYLSFLAGLWLAPTGGLLLHWPIVPLAISRAWRGAKARSRAGRRWSRWRPWLASLAPLVVLTLGLAKWHAPFGWTGWSNRLLVPWVPAIVLLMAQAAEGSARATQHAAALTGRPFSLAAACGCLLVGSMHIYAAFTPRSIMIFPATPACPSRIPPLDFEFHYYRCMSQDLWHSWDFPATMLSIGGFSAVAAIALISFVCLGAAAAVRPRARAGGEPQKRPAASA